jgi:hypothetical protein
VQRRRNWSWMRHLPRAYTFSQNCSMRQTSNKCVSQWIVHNLDATRPDECSIRLMCGFFFCGGGGGPSPFQLANNEQHRAHYALLEIFTYKTYQDYLRTIVQPFCSRVCTDPSEKKRTKGGIARTLANTDNKTQAPLSPELCHATTGNTLSIPFRPCP